MTLYINYGSDSSMLLYDVDEIGFTVSAPVLALKRPVYVI